MIQDVFTIWWQILLEFLAELYIFCTLIMYGFRRAKKFPLRLFAGIAAIAGAAFGLSFFYYYFGGNVFGRIGVYLVLFALVVCHARLCFAEGIKSVLFGCSFAYAVQNLAYKCFLVFYCAGEHFRLFDGWGTMFGVYYRLMYYAFFIAAAAAAWFLFIRRHVSRLPDSYIDYRLLIASLLVLCITVILCSVEDVHFAGLSFGRENRFENYDVYVLRQTGNIFSVLCCAVVLLLVAKTIVERDLRQEVEYLQHAVRQAERQYEISKDTIDLINVKCHDIKYKLGALLSEGNKPASEAVEDLKSSISIYDTRISTGNKILDVILTEKSLYCEQNGINFSCMADGAKLSFMDDGDLYCLFGNIVDNALEAVGKLPERERRVVNLVVKEKNGVLTVQEENYFSGELKFVDGLPRTTKGDSDYHGFGTRSIRMIVNKYGGAFTAGAKDGVFALTIVFVPDKDKKLQNK